MSYRIEQHESVIDAARRIAHEQVNKALDTLADADESRQEKVHEGRKRCKKVRGLLRLTRKGFEDTYDAENTWYRDAARTLSDLRDADAGLECFDALLDRFDQEVDRRHFTAIRQTLADRRDAVYAADDVDARLGRFRDLLEAGRHRIDTWTLDEDGFDAAGAGLKKTYKRARNRMDDAYDKPAGNRFHEWRKRVKYHRYHCRLLRHVWKPVLDERRDEVKRLSGLLGDAHDLVDLKQVFEQEPPHFASHKNFDDLLALIDRRQQELRAALGRLAAGPGARGPAARRVREGVLVGSDAACRVTVPPGV